MSNTKTTNTAEKFALLLRTDGTFCLIDWPAEGHLRLLYTAIDCDRVDAVRVTQKLTMWVDDEGMVNDSPANLSATHLYAHHHEPHQAYYGNAVFTGGADRHGNTLGLTPDQILELVEQHLTSIFIPAQRSN